MPSSPPPRPHRAWARDRGKTDQSACGQPTGITVIGGATLVSGLLLLALCTAGCATHADRLRAARQQFYANSLQQATETLDQQIQRNRGDADVLKLDRAIVHLAAGQPREAEQTLLEVRDQLDYLQQKNLGESAWSLATDDNRLPYTGEDYERVLIRAFLALSNLMAGGQDVQAYCWQIVDEQQKILQASVTDEARGTPLAGKGVALGAYIHGVLREETHANYDDAERAFAQVVSWQPEFRPGLNDLQRVQNGRHSAPGHGVLYVFALVGRGPIKEEFAEQPTSAALLIADRILSATGKHTLPPTIAPVKVPKVVLATNFVDGVLVSAGEQSCGATETITHVGQMAVRQHEAVYQQLVARAVVRRVLKKGMVYASKDLLGQQNSSLVNLAMDMTGVLWEATEAADTRCWGLLPDTIQVLRVELPAGQHHITLQPLANGRTVGPRHSSQVSVENGRNTYVLANVPGPDLVGQILTSR